MEKTTLTPVKMQMVENEIISKREKTSRFQIMTEEALGCCSDSVRDLAELLPGQSS